MKLKATKKDIIKNFSRIYLIDYKYGFLPDAFAYNSGYAWNWDAYDLGNICLIDGNRSFPKHKSLPKDAKKVVEEYERKVTALTFSEIVKIDKKYLNKFIKALLND